MSSAIRVALRVRPELESDASLGEAGAKQSSVTIANGNTVTLHRHRENGISDVAHQYTFDKVFEATSTQEEVYSTVRDLIAESLRGYNVTIFAFGMTGSGKTFTIAGQSPPCPPSSAGIVPRAVHQVFSDLRAQASRNRESVAMVFLTFVEL
jgi:hypothetical protein